jgi:hypothetical protein
MSVRTSSPIRCTIRRLMEARSGKEGRREFIQVLRRTPRGMPPA